MGDVTKQTETWGGDLLGFRDVGATFTKLVQSVGADEPGSKVISIEAGFGRGKTFFRENWAKELRTAGEVVVEIDARQSDHSGDPVVTFIGALVGGKVTRGLHGQLRRAVCQDQVAEANKGDCPGCNF